MYKCVYRDGEQSQDARFCVSTSDEELSSFVLLEPIQTRVVVWPITKQTEDC